MSKLQVDDIVNKEDNGSVGFSRGAVVTGVTTSTSFDGNVTGNISGGTVAGSTGTFTGDVDIADKIVHTGDTNTALRFPAADTVSVETGGSEALRVDSSQRLLIGTTSEINSSTASNFQIANASGPRLCIARNDTTTASGNLIGALDFYGNDSDGTYENCARILAEADADHTTDSKLTRLTFYTAGSDPDVPEERLRIDSSGNNTFTYNDASTSTSSQVPPGIRINNQNNTLGRLAGIHFAHGGGGTANAGIFHVTTNTTTSSTGCLGDLAFYMKANGSSTMAERLRITSDGYVSIGVASPQAGAQLTIAGKGIAITGQNTDHGANSMRLGEEGSGLAQIRCYGPDASTNGSLTLRSSRSNGTNSLDVSLLSNGNLSISDGNLVVASGHGIDFSAAGNAGGMTSELLDDYEEGTFTPSVSGFSVSGTTTTSGTYVKVGRNVMFGLKFANTGTIAYGTSCFITLPFSMATGTEANGLVGMLLNSNSATFNSNKAGTQCKLDGEGGSRFFVGNFTTTSNGEQLMFGGSYIAGS